MLCIICRRLGGKWAPARPVRQEGQGRPLVSKQKRRASSAIFRPKPLETGEFPCTLATQATVQLPTGHHPVQLVDRPIRPTRPGPSTTRPGDRPLLWSAKVCECVTSYRHVRPSRPVPSVWEPLVRACHKCTVSLCMIRQSSFSHLQSALTLD